MALKDKREELFIILKKWEDEICNVEFDKIIPMIKKQDKEFIKDMLDVCEENDFDVMIKDGEDGDITISLRDYIKQKAGDFE